jgi:AcrR family transcriptional regulator
MRREQQTKQVRDQILDATEAVIGREGVAGLTLDAVAARGNVSKGGLLHHFPSKDALVRSLVERCAGQCRAEFDEAYAQQPAGPGRVARAVLAKFVHERRHWNETMRRTSAAFMAVLGQDPTLMQPMIDEYRRMLRLAKDDGLEPGAAEVVIAALDGVWLWWLSQMVPLTDYRVERMRGLLERLVEWTEEPSRSVATRPRPRAASSRLKRGASTRRARSRTQVPASTQAARSKKKGLA